MCEPHNPQRRTLMRELALGSLGLRVLSLLPLTPFMMACDKDERLAPGMAPIKFDRDTCTRCSMVISDRRFAAQVRGGPKDSVFRFDDVGCLVFWLRDKAESLPWLADTSTRMWVADLSSKPEAMRWHDPRQAHYIAKSSPMGYNFVAVAASQADSLDFSGMRERVLAKGK